MCHSCRQRLLSLHASIDRLNLWLMVLSQSGIVSQSVRSFDYFCIHTQVESTYKMPEILSVDEIRPWNGLLASEFIQRTKVFYIHES